MSIFIWDVLASRGHYMCMRCWYLQLLCCVVLKEVRLLSFLCGWPTRLVGKRAMQAYLLRYYILFYSVLLCTRHYIVYFTHNVIEPQTKLTLYYGNQIIIEYLTTEIY